MVTLQFAPASIHTLAEHLNDSLPQQAVVSASDGSLEARVYGADRKKAFREAVALGRLYKAGAQPLNAPQLIDLRLAANPADYILTSVLNTVTITAIGMTRGGKWVYVVAHSGHPMTDPKWLRQAMPSEKCHVPAKLSNPEFWGLLDKEDGRPFAEPKEIYVLSEADMEYEPPGSKIPEPRKRKLLTAFAKGEGRKELLISKVEKLCGGESAIRILHRWRTQMEDDTKGDANLATFLKLDGSVYGTPVHVGGFDAGFYNSTPPFVGVTGKLPLIQLTFLTQSTRQFREVLADVTMSKLNGIIPQPMIEEILEVIYR